MFRGNGFSFQVFQKRKIISSAISLVNIGKQQFKWKKNLIIFKTKSTMFRWHLLDLEIWHKVNSVNCLMFWIFFLKMRSNPLESKLYQGRKHSRNATKYACDKQIKIIIRRTFQTWGSLTASKAQLVVLLPRQMILGRPFSPYLPS